MAFNNSLRLSNVVKAIATDKESQDLLPFELGMYDYLTNKTLTGGQQQSPKIVFALGNPNVTPSTNSGKYKNFTANQFPNHSFRSDPIFGKTIKSVRVASPSKTKASNVQIYGWDGFATNDKSLSFKFGKTYQMMVTVNGAGAASVLPELMSNNQTYTESISFSTPSKDDCAPSCTENSLCKDVLDDIVTKFYRETNIGASKMIKIQKLVSCDTPPTPLTKVVFTEFCLNLCDEGDGMSLAKVKLQYPALEVKRKSRTGTTSTYKAVVEGTTSPSAYTQTNMVIPNCESCGVGYTTVTGGKLLIVRIDNANVDNTTALQLAEVQSKIPTATSAVKTKHSNGVSDYMVVVPTTWVMPVAPIAETLIEDTGEVRKDSCTLTTPITTAWVNCGTKYKVKRKLTAKVSIPDCNGTLVRDAATKLLSELQKESAAYKDVVPGSALLVSSTTGNCLAEFSVEQYNNALLEDTCDTMDVPLFDALGSFKTGSWMPVETEVKADDCKCGLKFTGAFVDYGTNSCVFDRTAYVSRESIRFTISFIELGHATGFNVPIPMVVPMIQAQTAKISYLDGQTVIRDIIESRYYLGEHNFAPCMEKGYLFNAALGYQYGVDLDKFYYSVNITHVVAGTGSAISVHQSLGCQREEVFYFEESDLGLMQQFLVRLNAYTGSDGVNVQEVVI